MIGFEMSVKIHIEKWTEFLHLFDMEDTISDMTNNRIGIALFEGLREPNTVIWREH